MSERGRGCAGERGAEERRVGGLFTSEVAVTIDGKPPASTGAPEGPHNTNIRGDDFLQGKGREGSLLGVNESCVGGGSYWGGP